MIPRTLLLSSVLAVGIVAAQDPPTIAGRLNYVSGAVSFEPGGANEWVPATINRPLTVGDQLFADNGALAEIHIPGSALRLGSQTAFEFLNLDGNNVQVRLSEGTLNLRVRNMRSGNFEVDTPDLAFSIQRPGEYRIDTNPNGGPTYVTVRDGGGQITANAGAFPISTGQQAVVGGQTQGQQYSIYAAPGYDEFDNWALSRDRREERYVSARYVSPEVVGYEDLNEYGRWRSEPGYGNCWFPTSVAAGWAPYHDGHWAWVDPWGWTWVDDAPWGFAPFHYGRWAYIGGSWGWVPGPVAVAPVYAPALVAWVGFGRGFGVSFGVGAGEPVGWFPLGPRDVFIPAYSTSREYVTMVNRTNTTVINNTTITNVYNNYAQTGTVSTAQYANRAVPGAIVAVPQRVLASAQPVRQAAIPVPAAQISQIKAASAAPRVAPQMASVLGHANMTAAAPRPPATVLNRPIVAKSSPPPAPVPFRQREALLEKNPGKPLSVQQQQQIARGATPAERPAVKVVSQAQPIQPRVSAAPAPVPQPQARPQPGRPPQAQAPQEQLRPGIPQTPAQAPAVTPPGQREPQLRPRPAVPPSVPQTPLQAPPVKSPEQPRQPQVQPQPNRPFEPPRREPPSNLHAPGQAPVPQQNRPLESPAAPARPLEPNRPSAPQNRPFEPPREQPRAVPAPRQPVAPAPAPERRVEPSRPATPPPAVRPAEPRRQVTPPSAQPENRPVQAPPPRQEPPQERKVQPPPPEQRPAQPAPGRKQAPPQERKKEERPPQ